mgnify:CR=1
MILIFYTFDTSDTAAKFLCIFQFQWLSLVISSWGQWKGMYVLCFTKLIFTYY